MTTTATSPSSTLSSHHLPSSASPDASINALSATPLATASPFSQRATANRLSNLMGPKPPPSNKIVRPPPLRIWTTERSMFPLPLDEEVSDASDGDDDVVFNWAQNKIQDYGSDYRTTIIVEGTRSSDVDLIKPSATTTEAYIVYPGPEDVHIRRLDNGLFDQQSVTLTASMHHPPAVEAGPATNTIWGIPTLAWGILIGCSLLAVLSLATLFLCCWLFPRSRKFLSPTRCTSARTQITSIGLPFCSSAPSADVSEENSEHQKPEREIIMAHSASNTNGGGMPTNGQGGNHHHHALMYHQSPPQYNPPPVPPKGSCGNAAFNGQVQQQQQQYYQMQTFQKQQQQQSQQQPHDQKPGNYCSQIVQQQYYCHQTGQPQQKYHNYYRVNPPLQQHQQGSSGSGVASTYPATACSRHSGSGSSTDNSPKVSSNGHHNNGNGHEEKKRYSGCNRYNCAGGTAAVVVLATGGYNTTVKQSQQPEESKDAVGATAALPADGHKSMWAINNLHLSNSGLSDLELAACAYRTRSLPSWGKGNKHRPVSTTDDLEELYAKVNFSKKRRNRMRNDEAAIIALCRSKSQNLAGIPLDRDGIVVYDERTAL